MKTEQTAPDLSLVVAAWPDLRGLSECLEALAAQCDSSVELIVVAPISAPAALAAQYPEVRWLEAPAGRLIPHLWGLGMAAARGEVVAITLAHFTPAPTWVSALREAHLRWESAAIGGPIAPPRGGRAVDWATYFLRYSGYFAYRHAGVVPDVPGDNASYKKTALPPAADLVRDGFWELDWHRRLRRQGQSVIFDPAIRITQRTSFGFGRFVRQRFQHGRQFGRERLRGRGLLIRAARVMAAPLIPAVFLGKILGRVVRSGRDFGPFLRALPLLVCFILAWSLGEVCGYLRPD